ncbi:hypothetical protein DSO57_1035936 [Entomophthora muscae]|uniref:Uncharacterized protein n=1 Tax=Entomophthora muscae TaxID=34485 RepID=A0ACC2SZZ4_9FUNG|nr:hypothetical protein DSO57_1035936 [Entomophthora muscae]
MNYIIFTAVLTAYLGIGGHQPTNAQFGPEPQGPKGISYNEPTHLNTMVLNPWTPLASSHPTPNLVTYVIPTATLLYLAVSLRQCNILAKAFCQAVNFYLIVYALNGFEPPNLPSYVTRVLPPILGHCNGIQLQKHTGDPHVSCCCLKQQQLLKRGWDNFSSVLVPQLSAPQGCYAA